MNVPMTELNSITNYNKVFDANMKQFNENFEASESQFDSILTQQTAAMNRPPVINGNIELNVGLENMGITPLAQTDAARSVQHANKVQSGSAVEQIASDMGKAFGNGINNVNQSQVDMEKAVETMASGGDISAHEVMIAAEKATLSMQMAIQMRNKIITAYNEINNVRV